MCTDVFFVGSTFSEDVVLSAEEIVFDPVSNTIVGLGSNMDAETQVLFALCLWCGSDVICLVDCHDLECWRNLCSA